MTPLFRFVALSAFVALPASAQGTDPVRSILDEAESFCASFENGTFDAGEAVQEVDLDGVAPLDTVIDSSQFACSSMASAYCGTGGCALWTIVEGQTHEFQAEAWDVITWLEGPILLVMRDGGWCGGYGAQFCFEAVNWLEGQMMTVMPPLPN